MLSSALRGARCATPHRASSLFHPRFRSTEAPPFAFESIIQLDPAKDTTPYKCLSKDLVSTSEYMGQKILHVKKEALSLLASEAMRDIAHLLRPAHLSQLKKITEDPEASSNDKFVAYELLKNVCVSAGMVLPGCQDTGTAIVMGKKGEKVWTDCASDEEELSRGIHKTYTATNLRYSQLAPLTMYQEKNTGTNLPAQFDLYSTKGNEYEFLLIAKGGGSANKTFLYQQTKAVLNKDSLLKFLDEQIRTLGTSACPPYHLAIVVGGTSAEVNLKTVKMASTKYYDTLPTSGNDAGRAFRDVELEEEVHKLTQMMGIGAQFGGKYFCHDVRVIRLPRHGASCPIGLGVSCSADRQVKGKINEEGVFLEQLETDPAQYLPDIDPSSLGGEVVKIDLNKPMSEIRATLSEYPVKTRLSLSGTIIVARDIAHAKLQERINSGEGLPDYVKDHIIYYAGPAKTPKGMPSGSFGPTTAGRMDSYVDCFQENGGSLVTLAKGNRSDAVRRACKKYGGFYLGSIGGQAANLAKDCIKKIEVLEYPELGMEAIWKVDVVNFPAFIVIDDKGNDFFKQV